MHNVSQTSIRTNSDSDRFRDTSTIVGNSPISRCSCQTVRNGFDGTADCSIPGFPGSTATLWRSSDAALANPSSWNKQSSTPHMKAHRPNKKGPENPGTARRAENSRTKNGFSKGLPNKRMQLTGHPVTALAGSTMETSALRDDLSLSLTYGQGRARPPRS